MKLEFEKGWLLVALMVGVYLLLSACKSTNPPLPVVEQIDLNRYQGRWYEIASFPLRPQKNCTGTYAEYTLQGEYIRVYNHCIDSTNGKVKDITGKAWPENEGDNARLLVQFFWPFKAPYHVIALDTANYQYAMVGTPNRKYLWLLSRTPQMDAALQESLVSYATSLGFDTQRLLFTVHR